MFSDHRRSQDTVPWPSLGSLRNVETLSKLMGWMGSCREEERSFFRSVPKPAAHAWMVGSTHNPKSQTAPRFAVRGFRIPPQRFLSPQTPAGASFGDLTSAAEADWDGTSGGAYCRIEPAPGLPQREGRRRSQRAPRSNVLPASLPRAGSSRNLSIMLHQSTR